MRFLFQWSYLRIVSLTITSQMAANDAKKFNELEVYSTIVRVSSLNEIQISMAFFSWDSVSWCNEMIESDALRKFFFLWQPSRAEHSCVHTCLTMGLKHWSTLYGYQKWVYLVLGMVFRAYQSVFSRSGRRVREREDILHNQASKFSCLNLSRIKIWSGFGLIAI